MKYLNRKYLHSFIPMFVIGMGIWYTIRNSCGTVGLSVQWKVSLFIINLIVTSGLAIFPSIQNRFTMFWRWIQCLPETIRNKKKDLIKFSAIMAGILLISLIAERLMAWYNMGSLFGEFSIRKYGFAFVICMLISLLLFYREIIFYHIEEVIFGMIFCIGTLYALSLPAGTIISWDDQVHYNEVQMLSHFFDGSVLMADYNYIMEDHIDSGYFQKGLYEAHIVQMDTMYKSGTIAYDIGYYIPVYQKWCYFPSAIALLLGRGMGLPFHLIVLFGRWVNLWLYAWLLYAGIKKMKSGKMLVACYALFPTNILLATSYSYDAWVNAFIAYGICTLFGELQQPQKRITNSELAKMVAAFFVGFGPKAIYAPLLLLTVLLPKEKFKSTRQRKVFIISVLITFFIVLATFLIPFIFSGGGGQGDMRGGSDVNASQQTKYILLHPFVYAGTLLKFLNNYWALENIQEYTNILGYLGPVYGADLLLMTTIVTAITDKENTDRYIGWRIRGITVITVFIVSALVATALYITYTPVGADSIGGCQPRYLLPLILPVLLIFGSSSIENRINKVLYRSTILVIFSFVLLFALWNVCIVRF